MSRNVVPCSTLLVVWFPFILQSASCGIHQNSVIVIGTRMSILDFTFAQHVACSAILYRSIVLCCLFSYIWTNMALLNSWWIVVASVDCYPFRFDDHDHLIISQNTIFGSGIASMEVSRPIEMDSSSPQTTIDLLIVGYTTRQLLIYGLGNFCTIITKSQWGWRAHFSL